MGPHRKFLSRRQEEMWIQSFLVGVRRESGFTRNQPNSWWIILVQRNLSDSGENSCRKRILIFKKPPGRLKHKPEEWSRPWKCWLTAGKWGEGLHFLLLSSELLLLKHDSFILHFSINTAMFKKQNTGLNGWPYTYKLCSAFQRLATGNLHC